MSNFLSKAVAWFEGKKTILGGILTIAAAVAMEWYGKVDTTTALAIGGIGLTAVGLGDKANRHQAQILTALQGIATAGLDYRTGKSAQAVQEIESTAETVFSTIPILVPGTAVVGAAAPTPSAGGTAAK